MIDTQNPLKTHGQYIFCIFDHVQNCPNFVKKIIITLYLSYFASYIIVYSYLIKDDYPYMKNSQKKILCLYFSFFRNLAGPFEKLKSGGAILLRVGL